MRRIGARGKRRSGPRPRSSCAQTAGLTPVAAAGAAWLVVLLLGSSPGLSQVEPGAGRSEDLDAARFVRVDLRLVECRKGAGEIEVSPEVAEIYLDREPRRVAWVVLEREDGYRWILKKKGPVGKNVLPGKKEILRPEHDAFFSAEPSNDPRPGDRWRYEVRVERLEGDKWKLCARRDPEIFIHGNP